MTQPVSKVENSIMRAALISTSNVLGEAGARAVLRLKGLERYLDQLPRNDNQLLIAGADFAALFDGMLQMYGEQTARGLFRRWGAEFARLSLEARPAARLLRPMLNLLPQKRRAHTLLDSLTGEANHVRGAALHWLREEETRFVVTFDDCLYCAQLHVHEPICLSIVGTIETVLHWGTGRDYVVTETACRARGDSLCTFTIDKQPLNV